MLPVLLLFFQIPLFLQQPLWPAAANALALVGSLFAVPAIEPAARQLKGRWLRASTWRSLDNWRALAYLHVAVVPPWFFLLVIRGFDFLIFPLLYGLGIGVGVLWLVDRRRLSLLPTRGSESARNRD